MYVQLIVRKILYYVLAVNNTILFTLSDLVSEQVKSKEMTMLTVTHLLNCMTTNLAAEIRFYKSIMVLHIHIDGSYLSSPKS